jgi:ABC-2 type transport system permease protein
VTRAARVALANGFRAAGRLALRGPLLPRLALLLMLLAALGVALLAAWGTDAAIRTAAPVLAQLPDIRPMNLVERLLAGAFGGALALLLLGSLTTAVSTLFLSEELAALVSLPVPRGWLFARQLAVTGAAASGPTFLVAVPVIAAAARHAPRPALAAAALLSLLSAFAVVATLAGAALALALVRFVPPRRARFAAAFLSAIGLSAALVGFRVARPERLLDPVATLQLLETIGTSAPPAPAGPLAWAAHEGALALAGETRALGSALALLAGALAAAGIAARFLAPAHRRAWETSRTTAEPVSRRSRGRPARSLAGELWRAELRSLSRDASTPAQLGTLSAVAALYLLNVRLLPSGDVASRDVLLGVQTSLALFLVSALALRFGYPALSSDGRAALLLRSLPLSPRRHLLVRFAARALPALLVALVLVGVSALALRTAPGALFRALLLAAAGALAITALNVGFGALRPRYDAENPIAVALGPGGLFAIALGTALSVLAAPAASRELGLLLATLAGTPAPGQARVTAAWFVLAGLAGALPLAAAARVLQTREVASS